jgi:hypothetical protein
MTTPRSSTTPPDLEGSILNVALDLALEWGEYFLKPTQPRMAKLYPGLSGAQLDAYDVAARAVMSRAFGMLYDSPETDREGLARFVHAQHPWVNANNMARLHTQGVYYAHK